MPPPTYAESVGIGALIEMMMKLQHSLGELKSTVGHLQTASSKQSDKLDRISHILYATSAVLAVLAIVGGFLINRYWDAIIATFLHGKS